MVMDLKKSVNQPNNFVLNQKEHGWLIFWQKKKTWFLSMITCSSIPVQAYMCIALNLRNIAFSQDASRSRGSRLAWSVSFYVTNYQNKFVFAFSFPKIKDKKVRQAMDTLYPLLMDLGLYCWTLVVLSNFDARHSHRHARENRDYFIFIHWLLFIF